MFKVCEQQKLLCPVFRAQYSAFFLLFTQEEYSTIRYFHFLCIFLSSYTCIETIKGHHFEKHLNKLLVETVSYTGFILTTKSRIQVDVLKLVQHLNIHSFLDQYKTEDMKVNLNCETVEVDQFRNNLFNFCLSD